MVVSHIHEVSLVANRELHPRKLQQRPWALLTQGLFVGAQKVLAKAVSVIQLENISLQDPRMTVNIAMRLLRVQPAF